MMRLPKSGINICFYFSLLLLLGSAFHLEAFGTTFSYSPENRNESSMPGPRSSSNSEVGEKINLSGNNGWSITPSIAVAGTNVYIIWEDNSTGGGEILFSRSTDGGVTFEDPINISNNIGWDTGPSLIAIENTLYIVWASNPGDLEFNDIFYSRSTDGGVTFEDPINISNTDGNSWISTLSVSGTNVNVAWEDDSTGNSEVLLARSTDGGVTFEDPINISHNSVYSGTPFLIANENSVYIVWADDTAGNPGLLLSKSRDGGASFSNPITLSGGTRGSVEPHMALDQNNNLYVAWQDNRTRNYEILVTSSRDGGATFGEPINISNNIGWSAIPYILVSSEGNNVHVAWEDDVLGNNEILMATSTDGGASFGEPINISDSPGYSEYQTLEFGGQNEIYAVWDDDVLPTDPSHSNFDIFFGKVAP